MQPGVLRLIQLSESYRMGQSKTHNQLTTLLIWQLATLKQHIFTEMYRKYIVSDTHSWNCCRSSRQESHKQTI